MPHPKSSSKGTSRTVITLRFNEPETRQQAVQQVEESLSKSLKKKQPLRKPTSGNVTKAVADGAVQKVQGSILKSIQKKQPMRKPTGDTAKGKTEKPTQAVALAPEEEEKGVIRNFRKARGLPTIYRCGKTDDLVDRLDEACLSPAEYLLLHRAGLILDLRSSHEIRNEKVEKWTQQAPGGKIHRMDGNKVTRLESALAATSRCVVNLDVLSSKGFAEYVEKHWLTSTQERIQVAYFKVVDSESLQSMRVDALNKRGLFGLNEAILEAGKSRLCRALKAITLHLERKDNTLHRPVVIHCMQGKDRTGMLVMLLQSILGVDDKTIIEDYHASEVVVDFDQNVKPGYLDRAMMKSAPRLAMAKTLHYLREKYGSVSPGYLQNIGFDDSWRVRLMTVGH